jgi:NAD(P)-dependent dehydrogenase (short-subunit alcohol dehydrogenase family)
MKVALITGAARGIGAATARAFASAHYRVIAVDIREPDLDRLVGDLTENGASAIGIRADLSESDGLSTLVDRAVNAWGRIDVLVNNAAARDLNSIRRVSLESWGRVIATNLTAPAFLTQLVEPHMRAQGGGVVINVTSVEAHIPKGVSAAYAAAKGGLLSLTYDAAALLAGTGIRVVAVSPGAVDTEMGKNFEQKGGATGLDAEIREMSEQLIPARRWARPEEIARVLVWLAGDDASYITGTEITVDGGLSQTWMPRDLKGRIQPGEFD